MYTATVTTFEKFAKQAVSILNTLPGKEFKLSAYRDFVDEGVAYPVRALSIPSDGSGDIRFVFFAGDGCPFESVTVAIDRAVKSYDKQMKCAERREDALMTLESEILILDSFLAEYVSSREGFVAKVATRIASILSDGRRGRLSFDWKSYDVDDDIPRIHPYGTEVEEKVQDVVFSDGGKRITVSTVAGGNYKSYHFDLVYDPTKASSYGEENALAFNEHLTRFGIPDLLINVYYELPESYDIGDYELDFVKTC